MTSVPPYTLPLCIRKRDESFVVEDASGVALAFVYFEDEPTRRALVKRVPSADARTIAQAIARALTAEAEGGA